MNLFPIKSPGIGKKEYLMKKSAVKMTLLIALFFLFAGVAFGSSGGEHEPKGWVATDTYRVMNFAVLAVGLFFILRKPVSQGLNARMEEIENQLKELDAKKKDAEKKLAQYDEKLSALEKEAEKLIEEYIKQGNEAKARILEEARSSAEKLEQQARRNIEQEFKRAKLKLKDEMLSKALLKAEEIIKNKITGKDQDRLVEEYLEKVVA